MFSEPDINKRLEIIHQVSSLTHAHPKSLIACVIYIEFAISLLHSNNKERTYFLIQKVIPKLYSNEPYKRELPHFSRILNMNILELAENEIKSSGYVIESLEAALWCFMKNDNYKNVVLTAVNLGRDTDTIAAIAGGLAGIYYGLDSVPVEWINSIARLNDIKKLSDNFYQSLK